MKPTRLLLCDDDPESRNTYRDTIPGNWRTLFKENLDLEVCEDIVEGKALFPRVQLNEVGTYQALLLDLVWEHRTDGDSHGISLCKMVRAKFPELPIIILSEKATPAHFAELVPLSINGYISKQETSISAWCLEIRKVLEKAYVDRAGLPLYQLLREFLGRSDAWHTDTINEAASEVWRHENAHDKWNQFWDVLGTIVAQRRVKPVFKLMKNYFATSDLITLGALPSMRGHLEHVLYVYFTGYVVSHKLPIFREVVNRAAKNLLGEFHVEGKGDHYWDLFQLAWLACATLHDTGYSLELLPDIVRRVYEIQKTFPFAAGCSLPADAGACWLDWSKAEVARQAFRESLDHLSYGKATWIDEHCTFERKQGGRRINHGVASGALFIEKLHTDCGQLMEQQKDLSVFLHWAAAAMALHSLKHVGAQSGVALKLLNDPLSFLLLLCDELQIWDRERPDEAEDRSVFRRVELAGLSIDESKILASVSYVPYAGSTPTHKQHAEPLEEAILSDNEILAKYLDVTPLAVEIRHSIRGSDMEIPSLSLPRLPNAQPI